MGPIEAGLAGTDELLDPMDPTSVLDEAASGLLANPLDEVGAEEAKEEE